MIQNIERIMSRTRAIYPTPLRNIVSLVVMSRFSQIISDGSYLVGLTLILCLPLNNCSSGNLSHDMQQHYL